MNYLCQAARMAIFAMAIFAICGVPDEQLQQCALTLDKWKQQLITFHFIFLCLLSNTYTMTIAIPDDYLQERKEILVTT
jgi:hypothetical protein